MCVDTVFSGHICLYFIGQSDSKVGGQTGGREGPANQTLAAIGTFVFLIYILFFCLLPSLEGPQLDQERDWGKTRSKDLLEARLLHFSLAANGCSSPHDALLISILQ